MLWPLLFSTLLTIQPNRSNDLLWTFKQMILQIMQMEYRNLYRNALIKPVMIYGSSVWSSVSSEKMKPVGLAAMKTIT